MTLNFRLILIFTLQDKERVERLYGILVNTEGKIVVSDCKDHFSQTGTAVESFRKHGAGKRELRNPVGVGLNDEGRIVVTESDNYKIQLLSHEGETISIFGGSGPEKLDKSTSCIAHKNMFPVHVDSDNCI